MSAEIHVITGFYSSLHSLFFIIFFFITHIFLNKREREKARETELNYGEQESRRKREKGVKM